MPKLAGVESLKLSANVGPGAGSAAVDVQIVSGDVEILEKASDDLTKRLQGYKSLANIENTLSFWKKAAEFSA